MRTFRSLCILAKATCRSLSASSWAERRAAFAARKACFAAARVRSISPIFSFSSASRGSAFFLPFAGGSAARAFSSATNASFSASARCNAASAWCSLARAASIRCSAAGEAVSTMLEVSVLTIIPWLGPRVRRRGGASTMRFIQAPCVPPRALPASRSSQKPNRIRTRTICGIHSAQTELVPPVTSTVHVDLSATPYAFSV